MADVCSTKQYKKRKWRKRIIILTIIILLLVGIFSYFNYYINPIILTSNQSTIKSKANDIINQAISQSLTQTDIYEQLITISTDSSGNVSSISANTLNANKINNLVLSNCQTLLNQTDKLYLFVPLGTFSGIPLLNGIGPKLKVQMLPIGNVESSFKSNFTSVGINQTHHEIYLNFKLNISILLPGTNQTICVNSQVLIAESVIVGKVPEIYFGSNNVLSSQLNLVP